MQSASSTKARGSFLYVHPPVTDVAHSRRLPARPSMRRAVVRDLQIHANENARTRCPGVFNFIAKFSTLMARNISDRINKNCQVSPEAGLFFQPVKTASLPTLRSTVKNKNGNRVVAVSVFVDSRSVSRRTLSERATWTHANEDL